MPPDAEYSLALSEEERSLLMLCLGMAGGNAMYHQDYVMARTILDFTRTIQQRLYLLNLPHPAKSPDAHPTEKE